MERLTGHNWWVCIYRGGKRTCFSIDFRDGKEGQFIDATLTEDSIGCKNDNEEHVEPRSDNDERKEFDVWARKRGRVLSGFSDGKYLDPEDQSNWGVGRRLDPCRGVSTLISGDLTEDSIGCRDDNAETS
jgi:hypothetical protein